LFGTQPLGQETWPNVGGQFKLIFSGFDRRLL